MNGDDLSMLISFVFGGILAAAALTLPTIQAIGKARSIKAKCSDDALRIRSLREWIVLQRDSGYTYVSAAELDQMTRDWE